MVRLSRETGWAREGRPRPRSSPRRAQHWHISARACSLRVEPWGTRRRLTLASPQGIVAPGALCSVHRLVRNRDYSRTSASTHCAQPEVLHFAGFEVGQVLTKRVRIVNRSASAARVHVLPAQTAAFRVLVLGKVGHLAPGMAETVEVRFSPTECRVYHDAVRVHCGVRAWRLQGFQRVPE